MPLRAIALTLAVALAACPQETARDEPLPLPESPPLACPEGFVRAPSDPGCAPLLSSADCPPGTMPIVGRADCQATGWTDCPAGFEPGPRGWGCAPVLPDAPCEGATRAEIGRRDCRPLGSCDGPFPPPEATVFVDAAFPDARLDAAHHRTLAAALAAAPAGATVAVEAGEYRESIRLTRSATLVGRCAEKVVVRGDRGRTGLSAARGAEVEARGLTLTGHLVGARAEPGSRLTLVDCLIDQNGDLGLFVDQGALATLKGSAVRRTSSDARGSFGYGASAQGGSLSIEESELDSNLRVGVLAAGRGATLDLKRSVVARTLSTAGKSDGRGLAVQEGATARIEACALVGNADTALLAAGEGTTVELVRTALDTRRAEGPAGLGLVAQQGARLEIDQASVLGPAEVALAVLDGAQARAARWTAVGDWTESPQEMPTGVNVRRGGGLTLDRCALVGLSGAALVIGGGGALSATRTLVRQTSATRPAEGGRPYGWGLFAYEGARADLDEVSVLEASQLGALVADPGTRVDLRRALVSRTRPDVSGVPGIGLVATLDATVTAERGVFLENGTAGLIVHEGATASLADAIFAEHETPEDPGAGFGVVSMAGATVFLTRASVRSNAAVGVAFEDARGTLSDSVVAGNGVGIHAQGGSRLVTFAAIPSQPAPLEVAVSADTRFLGNGTTVGVGLVGLPDLGGLFEAR